MPQQTKTIGAALTATAMLLAVTPAHSAPRSQSQASSSCVMIRHVPARDLAGIRTAFQRQRHVPPGPMVVNDDFFGRCGRVYYYFGGFNENKSYLRKHTRTINYQDQGDGYRKDPGKPWKDVWATAGPPNCGTGYTAIPKQLLHLWGLSCVGHQR